MQFYFTKAKKKIRELSYNFDTDGYVAPDLTILNDIVTNQVLQKCHTNKNRQYFMVC